MEAPDQKQCSRMKAATRLFGDAWMLLILHASLRGVTRFDHFQRRLGIARNVLSDRLHRLVYAGILEKRPVSAGARRLEYRLTREGLALRPLLERIAEWQGSRPGAPSRGGGGVAAGERPVQVSGLRLPWGRSGPGAGTPRAGFPQTAARPAPTSSAGSSEDHQGLGRV